MLLKMIISTESVKHSAHTLFVNAIKITISTVYFVNFQYILNIIKKDFFNFLQ